MSLFRNTIKFPQEGNANVIIINHTIGSVRSNFDLLYVNLKIVIFRYNCTNWNMNESYKINDYCISGYIMLSKCNHGYWSGGVIVVYVRDQFICSEFSVLSDICSGDWLSFDNFSDIRSTVHIVCCLWIHSSSINSWMALKILSLMLY